MKLFRSITVILLLVTAVFANSSNKEAYYNDRFLICLQPDLELSLGQSNSIQSTGIESLDGLIQLREIRIIEQYLPGATRDDMDNDIILSNIYRLHFDPSKTSLEQVLYDFSKDSNLLYAEAEPIDRVFYNPNDSRYGQQWFLQRIQADDAWDLWDIPGGELPGDINIVLASVDSGVQYTHPDLSPISWVNQAEIPASIFDAVDGDADGVVTPAEILAYISDYNGNGTVNLQDALHATSPFMDGIDADDWDGNSTTYVDDLFGYDVSGATSSTTDDDNDPMGAFSGPSYIDVRMHGTHVGGLLCAATDNGTGIASTIFNGSLMSVKCLYDQDSNGYISGGYSGMLYAAKAGAHIINLSWGGTGYSASSQATINVIYDTYNSLLVAAAGNGNDNGTPSDVPHYPSGYDNVVSVTAVSSSDGFSWANYGNGEGNTQFFGVDLSAPGENIHSTVFTTAGSYSSWPGTSMASPIVASCFGLLKSANPEQSNDWLIDNILSTTDNIDDINPNYAGQLGTGRVNVFNAIAHSIFPALSYDSYSLAMVNDNGDGQLSPGEEARMRVNIFNEPGWVNATAVTAILRSTSPYITITDSTGSYGDIFNGNVGVNIVDRYQFSVSAEAPSGAFPFTLEVFANQDDHPYTVTLEFNVEASIWQSGFPVATGIIESGNAVVDLDGDGNLEVVFGALDSLVHAIQVDGSELAGFPVLVGNKVEGSPAVGDIDDDGDLEIVLGSRDYGVYVIQHDGSAEQIYTATNYLFAPASLADLDGDGDLEIVIPGYGEELIAIHHDGASLDGFPIALDDNATVGAAVGDLNGDGSLDIVVGTWGNQIHAYNLDGSELPGFPVVMNDKIKSAPAMVDLDGSGGGQLDLVFGSDDNELHALSSDGQQLWSFATLGQNVQTDPAVCDMDGDGDLEIVFGGLDRSIYVIDHTGTVLEGFPVSTGGAIYSSPAVADVDGDGLAELFLGTNDFNVYGLHLDGSAVSGFPTYNTNKVQGAPSIADFDGDGDVEVVVGTDDYLAVLDLPTQANTAGYWPTHRGNLYRTGTLQTPVAIGDVVERPMYSRLMGNFPNPFNPSTQIRFEVAQRSHVALDVIDLRGRVIATLQHGVLEPRAYAIDWNGQTGVGHAPAGVYLYRLTVEGSVHVGKMTLLK